MNALPVGTTVLTLDGALPVEFLSTGDRIITRDSGKAVLRRVTPLRRRVATVALAKGALGMSRPDRDAVLPADQQILLRDWRAQALFGRDRALAPLRRLVDGRFLRLAGDRVMDMVLLGFDAPHILYADGLELAADAQVGHPA